jgi:hypothetical protein
MSEKVNYLIDETTGLYLGEGYWPIDPVLTEQNKGVTVYAELNPLVSVAIAPTTHNAEDDNCYWLNGKWVVRRQEKKLQREATEKEEAAKATAQIQASLAKTAKLIAIRNEYVSKLGLSIAAANTMAGLSIDTL